MKGVFYVDQCIIPLKRRRLELYLMALGVLTISSKPRKEASALLASRALQKPYVPSACKPGWTSPAMCQERCRQPRRDRQPPHLLPSSRRALRVLRRQDTPWSVPRTRSTSTGPTGDIGEPAFACTLHDLKHNPMGVQQF